MAPLRAGHHLAGLMAVVLLSLMPGCRSVYFVEVAGSPDVPVQIEHCLSSLGLENLSSEPDEAGPIAADPDLLAIWASQYHESRWHLAATAYVWRDGDGYRLRFVPGPPGSDDSVVIFAEGFSSCLALHDPEIDVEVIASRRIDLW